MQCKKCNGPTVKKALFSSFYEHCDKCDSGDKLIAGQVRNAVKEHVETIREQFNQMNAAATNAWKQPTYPMPNSPQPNGKLFNIGDQVIYKHYVNKIYEIVGFSIKYLFSGNITEYSIREPIRGVTSDHIPESDLSLPVKSTQAQNQPKALYALGEYVIDLQSIRKVVGRHWHTGLCRWTYDLKDVNGILCGINIEESTLKAVPMTPVPTP